MACFGINDPVDVFSSSQISDSDWPQKISMDSRKWRFWFLGRSFANWLSNLLSFTAGITGDVDVGKVWDSSGVSTNYFQAFVAGVA